MNKIYRELSYRTSKIITNTYSTSFSRAVSFLHSEIRDAIHSIYGFVRLADEIVDTFHDFDKKYLLERFEKDYYDAAEKGISLNPALNSFLITVKKYKISDDLIRAFLKSMKLDLYKSEHNTKEETSEYIYGSAEVVGLMCLKVFTGGDEKMYNELREPAMRLGAAFQKVNFLRDIKNDTENLNRKYFHSMAGKELSEDIKNDIIKEIESDFEASKAGIKALPANSRLGVLIAYYYYRSLLIRLKKTRAEKLLESRIRVPDFKKALLMLKAWVVNKLGPQRELKKI